jgi:hypothetical protein
MQLLYIHGTNKHMTRVAAEVGVSAYQHTNIVGGLDWCSFRASYHTQVPELSCNGEKPAVFLHRPHHFCCAAWVQCSCHHLATP